MENATTKFWTQTPLNAINKLMDQTFSWAQDRDDLADMYLDDLEDFEFAVKLFRNSDAEALSNHLDNMDTLSREQLVIAFNEDLGSKFVKDVLGYEV